MALHPLIKRHLQRLGIRETHGGESGAIDELVNHVAWPRRVPDCSIERVRRRLVEQGTAAADWHEDAVIDHAPFYAVDIRLKGLDIPWEQFDLTWPDDFSGVDPSVVTPLGYDALDFYLLAENSDDPTDPLLFTIPIELPAASPRPAGLTVSELLSLLG